MKIPSGFARQGLEMQCRGCPGATIALVLLPLELVEVPDVVLDQDGKIDEAKSFRTVTREGHGAPGELHVLSRHGSRVEARDSGWRITCKKGHENRLSRRRAERVWQDEWVPDARGIVLHPFTP